MTAQLEPLEFRSPIATLTYRNGSKVDLHFSPEWQRKLSSLWLSIGGAIDGALTEAELRAFAEADISSTAVAQDAAQQALLANLLPGVFPDSGPSIEDLRRQLAAVDALRQYPEIAELQSLIAVMPREIPQALNTDSIPTFAGLLLQIGNVLGLLIHDNSVARTWTLPDDDGNLVYEKAALTAHAIVLGAGNAQAKAGSLGTTTTVLHGNAGGDPEYSAVDLTADVTGVLPYANGGNVSLFKALFDHYADVGSVTTGETDLYSDSIAAGQLANNGDKLEIEYGGIFVSSGTATREVRLYFGGTAIFDTGALTLSLSSAWTAFATIIRVDAATVRYMVSFTTEGAALAAYTAVGSLGGLTLANANILKITGQAAGIGAATNDIVAKLGDVVYIKSA